VPLFDSKGGPLEYQEKVKCHRGKFLWHSSQESEGTKEELGNNHGENECTSGVCQGPLFPLGRDLSAGRSVLLLFKFLSTLTTYMGTGAAALSNTQLGYREILVTRGGVRRGSGETNGVSSGTHRGNTTRSTENKRNKRKVAAYGEAGEGERGGHLTTLHVSAADLAERRGEHGRQSMMHER